MVNVFIRYYYEKCNISITLKKPLQRITYENLLMCY